MDRSRRERMREGAREREGWKEEEVRWKGGPMGVRSHREEEEGEGWRGGGGGVVGVRCG